MQREAKILIVDDAEENRLLLDAFIRELGYQPLSAANGKEALEQIGRFKPDLVLLDIVMPEMDGYQTLKAIRGAERSKDIPVVMISSIDETHSIIHCLKHGADDYLNKPFEPDILKARIDNCLSKYWYLRAEKELLEKTLAGSITILSDIIATLSPMIYGKSTRLRPLVRRIAEALGLGNIWEVEIATMFSHIGCVSLPQPILEKLARGRRLLPNEQATFSQHPLRGSQLLGRLPRLENIASMIQYQHKHFDGSGIPADELAGPAIPIGARILHVALDYDASIFTGVNPLMAIETLREKPGHYDPGVIRALEQTVTDAGRSDFRLCLIREIEPGMIFAENVVTAAGEVLISAGQEATPAVLARLRSMRERVTVNEPVRMISVSL